MINELDWTAIELDYRAGVLPVSAIAKKFGTSYSRISDYAQKYGWERKPLDPFAVQQAHGVASTSPSGPKFSMDSDLRPEEVTKVAVLEAAAVLDIHRKDVRKLRETAEKFSSRLIELFAVLHMSAAEDGTPEKEIFRNLYKELSVLIGDRTPAELLEQLSRVMTRLVQIEREAYGLNVLPLDSSKANEAADQVANQVNELWAKVETLRKEKSDAAKSGTLH